jgi:hypothetical protein
MSTSQRFWTEPSIPPRESQSMVVGHEDEACCPPRGGSVLSCWLCSGSCIKTADIVSLLRQDSLRVKGNHLLRTTTCDG